MSAEVSPSQLHSSAPLAGERVAVTGTMASMTHREAQELVEQFGGVFMQGVSSQTTLLVIGEEGWPLEPDGQPSVKLLHAQTVQERGGRLRMLSESEWLGALGLERSVSTRQELTPAMLSQKLGVSVHEIRRWERMKLITASRRVLRLPYFDLAEVDSAKRLAELVAKGVSLEYLAESFQQLQKFVPSVHQPLAQLQMMAKGREVLYRDANGWLDPLSGQRRLPFMEDMALEVMPPPSGNPTDVSTDGDASSTGLSFSENLAAPAPRTAVEWFDRGCHLAEEGRLPEAVEAYRAALIEQPTTADTHFHLADVLYRMHRPQAAIERYYAAVEHDHDFIEAWTQLGCVLVEQKELAAAQDAFLIALDRHPDYPDALFHLATLLQQRGESDAARARWIQYLNLDHHGPWSDIARQHLATLSETNSSPADDREG